MNSNLQIAPCNSINELSVSKVVELVACKITICNNVCNETFTIVGVYRVPNSCFQIFANVLHQLLTKINVTETIILGDFNVNFLENSIETQLILNQMGTFGFQQKNK